MRNLWAIGLILLVQILIHSYSGFAQSGNCGPNVPFYHADLTGNPDSLWISDPPVVRQGNCCGTTNPDRCIEFELILDSAAVAISFDIYDGAEPSGALFYQINCGPPTPVGVVLCLEGEGPHYITFCKPGANLNTYSITSYGEPEVSPGSTTTEGCQITIGSFGLIDTSIVWTEITSGTNAYTSYLNCTEDCDSVNVSPTVGYPPFVDYVVCGYPESTCGPPELFCDTIRVFFIPPIISAPESFSYCENTSGVLLDGMVNGGLPPYTFVWTDAHDGAGNIIGTDSTYYATSPGNYSLEIQDATYPECPAVMNNVVVEISPMPVVDAGPDQSVCDYASQVQLQGVVSGATGGVWLGGGGTFSPGDSVLNAVYTPSATEIANGSATLILETTGNGACNPEYDTINIVISPPIVLTLSASPILCYGEMASVTSSVSGGIPPYTYAWNTGQTSPNISNLPAGTYSLTVTDANQAQCVAIQSVTIVQNPLLQLIMDAGSVISCTATTTVTASAVGGDGTYSFDWNNGLQDSSFTTVISGEYIVTVTDGSGCTDTDTVIVLAPAADLTATIPQQANICFGTSVDITVLPSGGFGNYSYSWNTAESSQTINVQEGIYCVTVSDEAGCVYNVCTSVYEDSLLLVELTAPPVVCIGASATINSTISGGQLPYQLEWSTGETSTSITQTAGTYSLTVTDANSNNCTSSEGVTIQEEPPIIINVVPVDALCAGNSDGTATASVSGGIPPYSILWSTGSTGSSVSGLAAGNYSLTVTDSLNCSQSAVFSIGEPLPLVSSIIDTNHVSCFGFSDGSSQAAASGGTLPYSYAWSPAGGNSDLAAGLSAGSYIVVVTDGNGCTSQSTVDIIQPVPLTLGLSSQNVSCFGGANGSISSSAGGGTPGYSYNWSTGSVADGISGLIAGAYTLTVTDSQGCEITQQAVITEPAVLVVNILSSGDVSCYGGNDGFAQSAASGGTSPYSYLWSPLGAVDSAISDLYAGVYLVQSTDANGCTATNSVTIIENSLLELTTSPTILISCDSLVIISTAVSGGDGNYDYEWNTGATGQDSLVTYSGTFSVTVTDGLGCTDRDTITVEAFNSTLSAIIMGPETICFNSSADYTVDVSPGIPPYTYSWSTAETDSQIVYSGGSVCVTVTDAAGCIFTDCINILELDQLILAANDTTICIDDSAWVQPLVSGSLSPYTYAWSTSAIDSLVLLPAGTFTVTVTDSLSCTDSVSFVIDNHPPVIFNFNYGNVSCFGSNDGYIEALISGGVSPYSYEWYDNTTGAGIYFLPEGTYALTVTDAAGCTGTDSLALTQPDEPLSLSGYYEDVLCNGGTNGYAEVFPVGGTPPYNYLWQISGEVTPYLDALQAGNYSVFVSDSLGCYDAFGFTIAEPPLLTLSMVQTSDATCYGFNDGSAAAQAAGGTPPYSYSWPAGIQSDSSVTGLIAGSYEVTVTDANSCEAYTVFVINEPLPFAVNPIPDVFLCEGDSIQISAALSNGIPGFSYQWTPATGISNDTIIDPYISPSASTNYTLNVTDSHNCLATQVFSATVFPSPSVTISGDTAFCTGFSASVSATPGFTTYGWSDGTASQNLLVTVAGQYFLTATDANGCFAYDSVSIAEHFNPEITASTNNITCFGAANGSIDLTFSGGNPAYTNLWSTSSTSEDLGSLIPGTYCVTVTDSYGCTADSCFDITQPAEALFATLLPQHISCFNGSNGSLDLTVTGGTLPYIYSWSNGASSEDITDVVSASYTVVVSDSMGCTTSVSDSLFQPVELIATDSVKNASCGQNDGAIYLFPEGGVTPYIINWNTGASGPVLSSITAGVYYATVTDDNGCELELDFEVSDLPGPDAVLNQVMMPTCYGYNNGAAYVTVSGGTPPYTYLWNDPAGQTTPIAGNLSQGNYAVAVADSNNCYDYVSVIITEPDSLSLVLTPSDVICFGESNGWASGQPAGGTPPYTYQWSGGGLNPTDSLNTGLSVGTYSLYVTDSLQCDVLEFVSIGEPSPIVFSFGTTSASCFNTSDGTASVQNIFGGTPDPVNGYTFLWDSLAQNQTTQTATDLAPGSYCVTVSDNQGCTQSGCVTVGSPEPVVVDQINIADVQCFQGNNGSALIIVSGGSPGYSYAWANNSGGSIGSDAPAVSGLSQGAYNVTVTDANGCTTDTMVIISQPPPLNLVVADHYLDCFGYCNGVLNAEVLGGQPPYQYLWSVSQDSSSAIDLCSGLYHVTVTDGSDCQVSVSAAVYDAELIRILGLNVTDATCGECNGTAELIHNGDTVGTSYQWSIPGLDSTNFADSLCPGVYFVSVTAENGCIADTVFSISDLDGPAISSIQIQDASCNGYLDGGAEIIFENADSITQYYTINWSNGHTGDVVTGLAAGEYSFTVTDPNLCAASEDIFIYQPDSMLASIGIVTDADCYGTCNGGAQVLVTGGSGSYFYSWSSGQNVGQPVDLCAGFHTVTVTDANGCSDITQVIISEPVPLNLSATINDASCNGFNNGSIFAEVEGGSGIYDYYWPASGSSSSAIGQLAPGAYQVVVNDILSQNCQISGTFFVNEPQPLDVIVNTVPETCEANNGSATIVSTTGGSGAYNYSWSGTTGYPTATGLSSGVVYVLQVFDQIDPTCSVVENVVIGSVPYPEAIVSSVISPSCNGLNNGTATISVINGTGPYYYEWYHVLTQSYYSSGIGMATATNLPSGLFNVTVTDADGCSAETSFVLDQPTTVMVYGTDATTICIGESAEISATASGGVLPYTYFWSSPEITDNSQTHIVSPVESTVYQVTVIDANGCQSQVPGLCYVGVRPLLNITFMGASAICEGDSVIIVADVPGSDDNYTFVWNTGFVGQELGVTPIGSETYSVTVYDEYGCPTDTSKIVEVTPSPEVQIFVGNMKGCEPMIVQIIPSSVEDLNYSWTFGDASSGDANFSNEVSPIHVYNNSGNYTVLLEATSYATECSSWYVYENLIQVYPKPMAAFQTIPDVTSIFDPVIEFYNLSEGGEFYMWDFLDGAISINENPHHTYSRPGEFQVLLQVTSDEGCIDTVSHMVTIMPGFSFYAPSAFTPIRIGGDNENSYFTPEATGVGTCDGCYSFYIFDRWGMIIFESHEFYGNNPAESNRWNGRVFNKGRIVQNGVYTWYVKLVDVNGETHEFAGPVTVIR